MAAWGHLREGGREVARRKEKECVKKMDGGRDVDRIEEKIEVQQEQTRKGAEEKIRYKWREGDRQKGRGQKE